MNEKAIRPTKIEKHVTTLALGFPIELCNVPMVFICDEWTPDIDYDELARSVLIALCFRKHPFSGEEIAFVSSHFHLSYRAFAEELGVREEEVKEWERAGEKIPKMDPDKVLFLHYQQVERIGFFSIG